MVFEETDHTHIDWNSLHVIDRATRNNERKVREAFAIEEKKPGMNRDRGVKKSRTQNDHFT